MTNANQQTGGDPNFGRSEYRRGVEDALWPITFEDVQKATASSPEMAVNVYNRIAAARRKQLLTKKVTKWFAVFDGGGLGHITLRNTDRSTEYTATLFDTKEEAEASIIGVVKPVGVYPYEIEVPIN